MVASGSSGEVPSAGVGPGRRRLTLLVLLGVAVAYAVAQLVLFDHSSAPAFDEAVYISQVSPGHDALYTAASRSRGITYVIAPVTAVTEAMWPLRTFLVVVSSAALFGAFATWRRVDDRAAAVGAALFASTWLALFYGSQVMPNLYSALAAVALVGLVASSRHSATAGELLAIGGIAVLAGLFRPFDAVLAGSGCIVGLLVLRGTMSRRPEGSSGRSWSLDRSAVRVASAVLGGVAVGIVPWLVEMSLRFGGPLGAVRSAAVWTSYGPGTTRWGIHLVENLRAADGPLLGSGTGGVSPWVIGWWGLWVALALLGLLRDRRGGGATIAFAAGAFAGGGYLVLTAIAARFLFPAYGLAAVAAGFGLAGLWASRWRWAAIPVVGGIVALVVWHIGVADRIEAREAVQQAGHRAVGEAIASDAAGADCIVWTRWARAQIGFASGCDAQGGLDARLEEPPGDVMAAVGEYERVYFAWHRRTPQGSFLRGLPEFPVPVPNGETWTVYLFEP